MEKISIIVPIYNSEKYLERCLNSIINQTYRNIEIILINDGSKDRSLEICQKYKKIDNRIQIINKKNSGVSDSRNVGLENSSGEYIQYVDSDDYLNLNACEVLLENIKKSNASLVICGFNIIKNNNILRRPYLKACTLDLHERFENYKYITPLFASPCNKLYIRKSIKNKFNHDLELGEDLVNNLNYIIYNKKICIIEECLYNVVLDNDQSLNRKLDLEKLDKVIELKEKEYDILNLIYNSEKVKEYINIETSIAIHAFFRTILYKINRKEFYTLLDKYLKEDDLIEKVKKAKHSRKDYDIFNKLFCIKIKILIYLYFKIKMLRKVR